MECSACGTQNPDRARFCMSCGNTLPSGCPNCGAENPAGAKFCIECGTSLTGAPRPAAPASASFPAPEARPEERRVATVLFADLSGYTAVAERMDPEALKSMVDRALRRLGEEVTRFGGTVDKFIGDNVMAVFGAPIAHEDDPERAVRAGLAMQGAMDEINEQIPGVDFALRVGINSGEVLAGKMGDGLHRDRRRRERCRPPSVRRPARLGHRRRGDPPPYARLDRVREARAARSQGQG